MPLVGFIDMETWRIVIPIVVLVLCTIGAWYVVKLRWEEIRSKMYVYPKNGHHYLPLFRCRMKCPATGEWFDALIYQDYNTKHLYVRDRKDFFDKFVKLIDWENGTKDRQCESS